jgi:hypothetical protein
MAIVISTPQSRCKNLNEIIHLQYFVQYLTQNKLTVNGIMSNVYTVNVTIFHLDN